MIKAEKLLYIIVAILAVFLTMEISGLLDSKQPNGYSEKEVALMMKVKDLSEEIEGLKNENLIIEKDNERIKGSIGSDSVIVWNSSREYRDSLRAELFR